MKKRNRFFILVLLIGIIVSIFFFVVKIKSVQAISRYGSRGDEVIQIQTKLKNWGYYNGRVDGVYGSGTLAAVKSFQKKNGLTVDGIAGKKTLEAMGIFTSSTTSGSNSNSISSSSLILMRFQMDK